MKPSLGRIVHYADPASSTLQAAIITYVYPESQLMLVDLTVLPRFADGRSLFEVEYDENELGCWRWPQRV